MLSRLRKLHREFSVAIPPPTEHLSAIARVTKIAAPRIHEAYIIASNRYRNYISRGLSDAQRLYVHVPIFYASSVLIITVVVCKTDSERRRPFWQVGANSHGPVVSWAGRWNNNVFGNQVLWACGFIHEFEEPAVIYWKLEFADSR